MDQHSNRTGNIIICIGILLIAAALFIVVRNFIDDYRAGQASDKIVGELLPLIGEEKPAYSSKLEVYQNSEAKSLGDMEFPDYILNPQMDMPRKTVDDMELIGVLTIPDLGIRLPIGAELTDANLKVVPCCYSGSVYTDDLVISGHNYVRHFRKLLTIEPGTEVTFTDTDGNVFRYQVVLSETLEPMAVEEMVNSGWDLTIFTCNLGGATRNAVRCERIE